MIQGHVCSSTLFSCVLNSTVHCLLWQAHSQLLCVTTVAEGTVNISTGAGFATSAYSAAQLLEPPIPVSVVPTVWSTVSSTRITISGSRCARSSTIPLQLVC